MKKALFVALCFILVGLVLVNGTFALPDFGEVFQTVKELLDKGIPEQGGAGKAVHVALVSDDETQNLFPGGAVSRSFKVQNLGTVGVYFRLVYAIQYDAESWPMLNVHFTAGNGFDESDWIDTQISGKPFKMKVFTYTEALPSAAFSPDVSISIAMDATVTSEQVSRYRSDFLQTQVLAIDPTPFTERGFNTAEEALNKALPLENFNPF